MDGSRKRKLDGHNTETTAHAQQITGEEENEHNHEDDDRPRTKRWPTSREFKLEPSTYLKGDSDIPNNSGPNILQKLSTQSPAPTPKIMPSSNSTSTSSNLNGKGYIGVATDVFLCLFSRRISDLNEQYDPEMINPLSEIEVGELQSHLTNYLSYEEYSEETALTHLCTKATEFLENVVFPYMNENISHGHFRRTFVRIIRVLWEIRVDLNSMLSEFANQTEWGTTISEHCINAVYTPHAQQLVEVVLKRLHDKRQVQNINSPPEPHFIFEIAKYFTNFDDDLWKNPYISHIRSDTNSFLENFDLREDNMDHFIEMAKNRVEKEKVFASTFSFGRNTRAEAAKQVYNAFSDKHDSYTVDDPSHSVATQFQRCIHPTMSSQQNVDRFLKVLSIYAGGYLWSSRRGNIIDEIAAKAQTMISACKVSSNDWGMESLAVAVQNLAENEKLVSNALHLRTNKLPGLRTLVRDVFKDTFDDMFPQNNGPKLPEEFLADFVEHIGMNSQAGRQWRKRFLAYMITISKHIQCKELFMANLHRLTQAHVPQSLETRNKTFLEFFQAFNRITPVLDEHISFVRQALRPRLSAEQATERRASVVFLQFPQQTTPTTLGPARTVTANSDADSSLLFTVAVNEFCGQRKSAFIRMTRMQLDIFNFLLQFRNCTMSMVKDVFIRSDISATPENSDERFKMVVESLETAGLLTIEETEEGTTVTVGKPTLTKPYIEVGPVDPEMTPIPTDIQFMIDKAIVERLEEVRSCSKVQLFDYLFQHVSAPFEIMSHRLTLLKERKFVAEAESDLAFVSFTGQQSSYEIYRWYH